MRSALQEAGKGVPKDVVQAAKWYALASGDDGENDGELFERAKRQRETLAKSMSPAQIALSDQLLKDFKPAAKRLPGSACPSGCETGFMLLCQKAGVGKKPDVQAIDDAGGGHDGAGARGL